MFVRTSGLRYRLRTLVPIAGPNYELFDSSLFLFVLTFVGYVITDPTSITDQALTAPFTLIMRITGVAEPQIIWGSVFSVVAMLGVICAYSNDKMLNFGFALVGRACLFASGSFLFGMIAYGTSVRAFITAVTYGWVATRLVRARHLYPTGKVNR